MRTGAARSCPCLGGDSQRSAWRRWRQQGHRPLPAVGESGSAEGSGPAPEEMSEESSRISLLCEASPQRKAVVGSAGRQSHQGGGLRPAVPQRNAGPVLQGSRAGPMAVAGPQDPRSPPGPQCPLSVRAQGPLTRTPAGVRRTSLSAGPALFQGYPGGPPWAQGPLQCHLGSGSPLAPPRLPGSSHPSPAQCPPGPLG